MALVRCTCVVQFSTSAAGGLDLRVDLLDPSCGYVVHRLGADLLDAPAAGAPRSPDAHRPPAP